MRLVLLLILLLAGCATEPTPIAAALPAPPSRVLAPTLVAGQQSSTLTVVADRGSYMATSNVLVKLDGVRVATLKEGEMASFQIAAGERQISADYDWNLGQKKPKMAEFIAQPGQRIVFRVGFESIGGTPALTLSREMVP